MAVGCLTLAARHDDPVLHDVVDEAALASRRPVRPVHLEALLNLPRVADGRGLVPETAARSVVSDAVARLPEAEEWAIRTGHTVDELRFDEADPAVADDVTRRFHYLHSPRRDSTAWALFLPGSDTVGALCVVSALDVDHLGRLLRRRGRPEGSASVVSRLFAFPGMPRNSVSFLLSRTAQAVRRCGVSDLVTYVNPNMGFTGVSYLASGWAHLGEQEGTTYRYLDGRYVTDRELAARFGEHDDAGYRRMLGDRFAVSSMPLLPLQVFWRSLS